MDLTAAQLKQRIDNYDRQLAVMEGSVLPDIELDHKELEAYRDKLHAQWLTQVGVEKRKKGRRAASNTQ